MYIIHNGPYAQDENLHAYSMMAPRIGTPSSPLRLAVLISGGGSGMRALLDQESRMDSPCFTTSVSYTHLTLPTIYSV